MLFSWYYHFFILSHHSVDYPEPQYVRKYIVFEHCLLSLFRSCNKCGHLCTDITKHTIGTFLRLKRYCKACDDTVTWDSQTFIRNTPAGNILLSSSILFSGALPTKVLRVLTNLGCASITKRTYFNHQRYYLQPAILSVWSKQQKDLLVEASINKRALILGGDGRADSPGHSAKYGSYTVMELEMGVVIDVQLVQVCHSYYNRTLY